MSVINEKTVSGIVLLTEVKPLDGNKILANLETKWYFKCQMLNNNSNSIAFMIGADTAKINYFAKPLQEDVYEEFIDDAYFWQNVKTELRQHRAYIAISVSTPNKSAVEQHAFFSKIVTAILEETEALGVFLENQTLLLPKNFYITNSLDTLKSGKLPLFNWIYFGFEADKLNSVFTFGLREFGREEIEIINSKESISALKELLYGLVMYNLKENVFFKKKENVFPLHKLELKFSHSEGEFAEGKTLKLDFYK